MYKVSNEIVHDISLEVTEEQESIARATIITESGQITAKKPFYLFTNLYEDQDQSSNFHKEARMALSTALSNETEKESEEFEMLQINPINQHEPRILDANDESREDFISFRSFSKVCD